MNWPIPAAKLGGGIVLVIFASELGFDGILALTRCVGGSACAVVVLISGLELENAAAGAAANLAGFRGVAFGAVLGGAIFLALAVAGLSGVVPSRIALPGAVALRAGLSPLPLATLALGGVLTRLDGVVLLAWFGACIVGLARAGAAYFRDEQEGDERDASGANERVAPRFHPAAPVVGLAVLGVGGHLLSNGWRAFAARIPCAPTLLGNTVLAAAVEGEEVGRVAAPARRGRGDLALGTVLGTVVRFLTPNVGVIVLARPALVDRATATTHLPAAVLAVAACLILIRLRTGKDRAGGAVLPVPCAAWIAAALRWPGGR